VPVDIIELPDDRFPPAAEATAYFTVAEALTNVAKYANATHATVRLAQENGDLAIEVQDDGKGGAAAAPGSGLAGLADRVGALDGVLEVTSPPGEGTLLRAVLPL
jgi:signal transduction histidine kinase